MERTENHPAATRSRRFYTGVTLAGALSAITGVISYEHGLEVARWLGNHGLVAYLVPLVPDLLIASASLTLLEASAMRSRRPWIAMAGLVAGIGWTVAMNIGAGWHEGPGGRVLNAGIPLAFVLTFESLLWLIRRGRGATGPGGSPATSSQQQPAGPLDTMAALRALLDSDSQRKLAELLKIDRNKVQAWSAMTKQAAEPAAPGPPAGTAPDASSSGPAGASRGQDGKSAVDPRRRAEHGSRPEPRPAGVASPQFQAAPAGATPDGPFPGAGRPAASVNGQAAGG